MNKRIAVVLFNLGGPDNLKAVQPFLFNLFFDPAIINLPLPFRWLLAKYISKRRAPIAQEIYEHLGGKSPILNLTKNQSNALQLALKDEGDVRCFIAMRYWHPMTLETAGDVKKFAPDEIILLPLYPQFSTATTGSSFQEWHKVSNIKNLCVNTKALCCYPTDVGWIDAQVDLILEKMKEVKNCDKLRILFSAHGLPKKIIDAGDPYKEQVERTAIAIAEKLDNKSIDWIVCYQSKVGRLEWIGPSLDDEINRASVDGVGVLIVPIAFVSEHSETLVELDIEYKDMAEKQGVLEYHRVPAVGTHPDFISGLAGLVKELRKKDMYICSSSENGTRTCSSKHKQCPLRDHLVL
jgi:ferrochelatase